MHYSGAANGLKQGAGGRELTKDGRCDIHVSALEDGFRDAAQAAQTVLEKLLFPANGIYSNGASREVTVHVLVGYDIDKHPPAPSVLIATDIRRTKIVLWSPFKSSGGGRSCRAEAAKLVRKGWETAESGLGELLEIVRSEGKKITPLESYRRLEGRYIYIKYLVPFTHGQVLDITNSVLAPLRVLATYTGENLSLPDVGQIVQVFWDTYERRLRIDELARESNFWGEDLETAWKGLTEVMKLLREASDIVIPFGDNVSTKILVYCESFMSVLSELRRTAGEPVRLNMAVGSAVGPVVENAGQNRSISCVYKVLLVDDHAFSWRPVMKCVARELSREIGTVAVYFCSDGKNITDAGGVSQELLSGLSEFDLVILDIYMGAAPGGLALLQHIRKNNDRLPIIIWTSSMEAENPAQAALANGFVFKKTATVESISEICRRWLPIGRSRRRAALANPFFDHVIRDERHRDLLMYAADWCLKQMDSFHALDGEYFRYFTDHGGRHLVKLLGILEYVLAPFLLSTKTDGPLPTDDTERATVFFLLYLAVLTHEVGMFPLRINGRTERFESAGSTYLDDVRTLHAVRGMVLLADDTYGYWPDREGENIARMLDDIDPTKALRKRLAVLVGYHARFLQSLREEDFLKWTAQAGQKFRQRIRSHSPFLVSEAACFEGVVASLHSFLPCGTAREALRKQCALFRLADALDVTASRNPADFLIVEGIRHVGHFVETLKRQLCANLDIDGGRISLNLLADCPRLNQIENITNAVLYGARLAELNVAEPELRQRIELAVKKPDQWRAYSLLKEYQKAFDNWLATLWHVIMRGEIRNDCLEYMVRERILCAVGFRYAMTEAGHRLAAMLAGLSVAVEILTEYQAIEEAGLNDAIKPVAIYWDGYDPKRLSMLAMLAAGTYGSPRT